MYLWVGRNCRPLLASLSSACWHPSSLLKQYAMSTYSPKSSLWKWKSINRPNQSNILTCTRLHNRLKTVRIITSHNKRRTSLTGFPGLTRRPPPNLCATNIFPFISYFFFIKLSTCIYRNLVKLNRREIPICIFLYKFFSFVNYLNRGAINIIYNLVFLSSNILWSNLYLYIVYICTCMFVCYLSNKYSLN